MVVDDIQQKSQEEHKGGLDEILHFGDSLEDLTELVRILSQAFAEYIFDGTMKGPHVSVNGETGEINMDLNGIVFSKEQMLRSVGKDPYIEKNIKANRNIKILIFFASMFLHSTYD